MSKLLYAGFSRLIKDKVLWGCSAAMFLIGLFVAIKTGADLPLDRTFFVFTVPLALACAVQCSLFLGTEYSDGTLRNKLVVGHSRVNIYLSNLILCAAAGLFMGVMYLVPMCAVGIPRLGFLEMGFGFALAMLGIACFITVAFVSLYTMAAMLCRSKAAVAVICIVGFIALLAAAIVLNSALQEPEMLDNFVYLDSSGMSELAPEPNPNYISGAKREVYQFIFELLPTGQAMLFTDSQIMAFAAGHLWRLPLLSLLITLASAFAGIYVFRKKDIK